MNVECIYKLINFRQYILERDDLIRRISDFHIISTVLSAYYTISFLEVGFYLHAVLIYTTRSYGDDFVERWAFLIRTIGDDDTGCCDLVRVYRSQKYSIREGSNLLDHVMSDGHKWLKVIML